MSILCTDKDKLEALLKHSLKESRYIHSLGVEKMAVKLAKIHGADVEKAAFAGRYHDIAKCLSEEVMNRMIRMYGISQEYYGNAALCHSKAGAAILAKEFGVADEEVLNAVSYHTTGRAGMSLLEEIIYVSDAIEENRSYPELEKLQIQAESELDEACIFIMDYTIDNVHKRGRVADKDTGNARKYIYEKILRRKNEQ